jgi:hypothetical protein
MTIERMEEQLAVMREKKAKFNEDIDRKINNLSKEHEQAIAAQTQRIFAKHKLDPDELNKLKFASKEQLKKVLDFINEEIQEPEKIKPETAMEEKSEKENQNHEKEVTN